MSHDDLRSYECHLPTGLLDTDAEGPKPRAILRYQQEIDGRIESSVALRSVAVLHSKLGLLYFCRRDYQFAEDQFRRALRIEKEMTPDRGVRARRCNLLSTYDSSPVYAHLLAMALDAQAKEREAIEILNGIKFMNYTPTGKGIFWDFIRMLFNPGWEFTGIWPARELLVDLLIKQRELDKVLSMYPLSTLDKILAIEEIDDDSLMSSLAVRRALKNIWALAHSLFDQGRRFEATHIFRQRQKIYTRHFGHAHSITLRAMGEFMLMLSEMQPEQIQEALCLEVSKLNDSSLEANNDLLLVRTIYAYVLSKNGQLEKAIAEVDLVLRVKDRVWTEVHYTTQGCMSPLADVLGFHGIKEWREPMIMQQELVLMLKRVSSPRIRESVIALLCALARIDGLKDALILMKRLVTQLRFEYPDQWSDRWIIQRFSVFTLASLGFCFQDAEYLNEALSLGNAMKNEISLARGPEAVELLEVVVLLASVYSKKSIILCHLYGFGLQEISFMKEAESVHRLAVDMAIKMFGDTHEKSTNALEQLEALVSRYATARANEYGGKSLAELRDRTTEVVTCYAESHSPSGIWLLPTSRLLSERGDQALQLQYFTIEDAITFQKAILEILGEQLDLCHPVLQAHKMHVGCLELKLGRPRKALDWLQHIPFCLESYHLRSHGVLTPHPQIIQALQAVAQAYEKGGATYISRPILQSTVQLAQRTFRGGDAHPSTTLYRLSLMRAFSKDDDGCPAKTISNAQDRVNLAMETFGKQHTQTIYCMNELAEALLSDKRRREALLVTYEALELGLPLWAFSHRIASQLWENFLAAHNRIPDGARFRKKLKEVLLPSFEYTWVETKFADDVHSDRKRIVAAVVEAAFASVEKMILSSWALGPNHIFTTSMKHEVKSLKSFSYGCLEPIIQQGTLLASFELPLCEPIDLGSFIP